MYTVYVKNKPGLAKFCRLTIAVLLLSACGGGGGSGGTISTPTNPANPEPTSPANPANPGPANPTNPAPTTSLELLDPTPGQGDRFGDEVAILANGNIVIADPGDSSVVPNNGAVHLYRPDSQTPIASFYGDAEGDFTGGGTVGGLPTAAIDIITLTNGNFIIILPNDDVAGIVDAGSVRLFDGDTGAQIAVFAGDVEDDRLDDATALTNGNFVITISGTNNRADQVRLINGDDGTEINATVVVQRSLFNITTVTALANGNFVATTSADAGSVQLFNGGNGTPIDIALILDADNFLSSIAAITALSNGNFVIAPTFRLGQTSDASSARLIDGANGEQIGDALVAGNEGGDFLAALLPAVTALTNGNFVITTSDGDTTFGTIRDGTAEAGGSVRLFDGGSGEQVGASSLLNDFIGFALITPLSNNNFVVTAPNDNEGGIANAGSVRLFNGGSGTQIGATRAGDANSIGRFGNITALANNNFVIVSIASTEAGLFGITSSLQLIDGSSGTQVGTTLESGDEPFRFTGLTAVGSSNFLFAPPLGNLSFDGIDTVSLFNGNNGAQISTLDIMPMDDDVSDTGFTLITASANNDAFYIVRRNFDDNNGIVDSGRVLLVTQ